MVSDPHPVVGWPLPTPKELPLRRPTLLLAALALVVPATAAAAPHPGASGHQSKRACADGGPGVAACHARVVTKDDGTPFVSTTPYGGYGPAQLQAAYGLASATASGGAGRTVVLVDAYDAPTARGDLDVYRSAEGLPPLAATACTVGAGSVTSPDTTKPCFTKLNQRGVAGSYPAVDSGWAQESSLDVDMVSAICPKCNIVLVEADSAAFTNLVASVDTARGLQPAAISNSYGGREFSGEQAYASNYDYPNTTVSSGDSGYGAQFPAALGVVTAVGGTALDVTGSSTAGYVRNGETAWSGAGSGCSAYIPQPAHQAAAVGSACTTRTGKFRAIADVSAVADPNTGVDVYDSTPDSTGAKGWLVFGGTSVAAPLVAGVAALGTQAGPSYAYAHSGSFFDVLTGANGRCKVKVLCTAQAGWDGPTGLGTPNGTTGL